MYGVAKGVRICNIERLEQLNNRIYDRNIPSHELQSNFDPRPVKTRQVLFPTLDCYQPSNTPINNQPTYNQHGQFNPGSSAPYSGWATNIDNESKVKTLFRTTQKWAPQNSYIPGSQSDMYVANKNMYQSTPEQTSRNLGHHELLFKREQFDHFNPNKCGLGMDRFDNHTRQQTKNL
jgi:hypothetical protein